MPNLMEILWATLKVVAETNVLTILQTDLCAEQKKHVQLVSYRHVEVVIVIR